jgi:hypothetical protein
MVRHVQPPQLGEIRARQLRIHAEQTTGMRAPRQESVIAD